MTGPRVMRLGRADGSATSGGSPLSARELNYYGQPITPPEYFDGKHVANPMGKGLPPVCSCGWTPHQDFTMADHLADMGDFA